ncbi:MAG: hypothetical protein V7701_05445 [Sneathiella sp.]
MKFLNFLVSGGFRKNDKDDILYFPWNVFGAGYILDSPDRKKQIQIVTALLFLGVYPLIIAATVIFGTEYVFLPLTPIWLCHLFVTKWLTRGATRTDEEKNLSMEVYAEQYSKLGTGLLIFTKWGCILMTPLFLWMISLGEYWYTGVLLLFFSGYFFAVNSAGLREKRRHNPSV